MIYPFHFAIIALLSLVTIAEAQSTLTIDAGKQQAKASPVLYGLMTEEINHSYDGGLYAELVRNRAFLDHPNKPDRWLAINGAHIAVDRQHPFNETIPTSLRVEFHSPGAGVANEGYWGIPVRPSTTYKVSLFAKAVPGFPGTVTIALQGTDGQATYAKAEIPAPGRNWKKYEAVLTTGGDVKPTLDARLTITTSQPGTAWFSMVSLFPPTWENRPNGLRPDLMQMLVDLKPGFLRFPGGNYLEGNSIKSRFDWKKTVGPLSGRSGHDSPWRYRSSDGMGLLEFLFWCEDMKAEPVLAVYAGRSQMGVVKSGTDLQPFVDEALEEIEYVTGPSTSKWGAQRAKDGHSKPFSLKYVKIGNQDSFDYSHSYDARFTQFYDAIKEKYPNIKIISSVPLNDDRAPVKSRRPDVVSEYYFSQSAGSLIKESPAFFDQYDRHGPEICVGEWASRDPSTTPWNSRSLVQPATPNMQAALGDAAWMAAMERNSDIVTMQSYAPLFANVNDFQWRPNLIGYNGLTCYGSPSYYAFRMFSTNVGDEILKASFSEKSPLHHSVTRDSKTGTIYVKLVNPTSQPQSLEINVRAISHLSSKADAEVLAAEPDATNSIMQPERVIPVKTRVKDVKPVFSYTVPANGIVVLKLMRPVLSSFQIVLIVVGVTVVLVTAIIMFARRK